MIRVGIIGCGGMAGGHAKNLAARDGVELCALCDVNAEIVEAFIARNVPDATPKPTVYTETGAMFAEAKLDAVVIVSPHTIHYQHGCEALEAGCHIFMEKPMVTDSGQAHDLARRVEAAGKILVIGYNTPCTPEFAFIRKAIRENLFGRLELVNGFLSQNWLKPTAGKWRQDPKLSGGGQAYDSGAHLFNSLVWSVESPVAEVFAFIDKMGTEVDINSATTIRFQNGVLASIVVGGNCPGLGSHMVFCFEHGRIEVNGWFGDWIKVFGPDGKQIKYPEITEKPMSPVDNFIGSILGTDEPRTGPVNGIHQSELMDAIYASAGQGRPVKASELSTSV